MGVTKTRMFKLLHLIGLEGGSNSPDQSQSGEKQKECIPVLLSTPNGKLLCLLPLSAECFFV